MKRLVSAALALTMLSGTAAVAAPYDHGGYNGGYGDQYRRHDNNNGAIVAGVGILALAAILASQHHHRHYHQIVRQHPVLRAFAELCLHPSSAFLRPVFHSCRENSI